MYEKFEDLSLSLKNKIISGNDNHKRFHPDILEFNNKLKTLLIKEKNEGEEIAEPAVGFVPNILDEFRIFKETGIYFGDDETYILLRSLTKLA